MAARRGKRSKSGFSKFLEIERYRDDPALDLANLDASLESALRATQAFHAANLPLALQARRHRTSRP